MGCCNTRQRIAVMGGEPFRMDISNIPNIESLLPKDTKRCLRCGQLSNLSNDLKVGHKRVKVYDCPNCKFTEQVYL